MKIWNFCSVVAFALSGTVFPVAAEVCEDFPVVLTPPLAFGSSPITVQSSVTLPAISVTDVNVTLNVNHTYTGDVQAILTSPLGTSVFLVYETGGFDNDFIGTVFDDEASTAISSGSAPFTGSFIPQQPLSSLDGAQPAGSWTLTVGDLSPAFDDGSLVSWTLSICGQEPVCASGQELVGAFACTACSPGSASSAGAECLPCETDTIAANAGSAVCTPCADGLVPDGSRAACDTCAAGTAELTPGICTDCPPGYIAPSPGAAECQECPTGTVPNSARTACVQDVSALDCTTINAVAVPAAIPDAAQLVNTLEVTSDVRIADLDLTLSASHGFMADLEIDLTSPSGTTVRMSTQVGGNGTGFDMTVFDDEADLSILGGTPPYSGPHRPESPLSAFDGENAKGTWTLTVRDEFTSFDGQLNSWSLKLCTACVNVSGADLPLTLGLGQPIASSTTNVSGTFNVGDVDVVVSLTHDYLNDVELTITSPSGTSVVLTGSLANTSGSFDAVRFDDESVFPISYADTTATGPYIPENPLSAFDGEPANGTWTLSVTDVFPSEDDGVLEAWSLEVCPDEEAAATCPSNPPYPISDTIFLDVIDDLPSCCDTEWNIDCQTAYHLLSRDCGVSNFNQNPQAWSSAPGETGIATSEIVLEGAYTLEDLAVYLEIDASDVTYLTITLNAPNGTGVVLYDQTVSGTGFRGTGFADDAATEIVGGTAPYTGIFRPAQPLSVLNGAPLAGTWSLTVEEVDGFGAGTSGTLKSWGLCAGTSGCFALSPYPDDDPLYLEVISDDSSCCSTEWSAACQQNYDVRQACQTRGANLLANGGFEDSTNGWLLLPPSNNGVFVQTTRSAEGIAALGFERGGIVGGQTGSFRQAVTIPSSPGAQLEYAFSRDALGPNTTGSLDVFVDGNLVDSVDQSLIPGGAFEVRSIDLSFYADNAQHTIAFSFSVSSGTGASSIIYLDAIKLTVCTGPGEGEVEGGNEGGVEGAVEGGVDGEGAVDGQIEGVSEGVTEGEGTIEGGSEGPVEGEGEVEGATEGEGEGVIDGEGQSEGEGEGQLQNPFEQLLYTFASADVDSNSLVTLAEILAQLPQFTQGDFDSADANDDGSLSVAELLALSAVQVILSADTSGDFLVSLGELLRVVQLYNAGGYACAANPGATEDGFTPVDVPGLPTCVLHGLDRNGDNRISLSELLRGIQVFNFAGYSYCDGQSEDSFCDR